MSDLTDRVGVLERQVKALFGLVRKSGLTPLLDLDPTRPPNREEQAKLDRLRRATGAMCEHQPNCADQAEHEGRILAGWRVSGDGQ